MNRLWFLNVLLLLTQSLAIEDWNGDKIYDFIIVGAGAAGGTLVSRLSEDGKYSVLLLEAGGEPHFLNKIPLFAPGPFGGELDWAFETEPQKHACLALQGEKWAWPRGKGLGGSTLINALVYNRAAPQDYDAWEQLGNEGWGYKDVLPYFKKLEDFKGHVDSKNEKYHGFGGPVPASRPPYETELLRVIVEAGKELGYSEIDYNGEGIQGFAYPMFIVKNGSRHSVYDSYLHEARKRPNLEIVTYALVEKVEFKGNIAIGVVFEQSGKMWKAKAVKEIILSGGAVNTPQTLFLSGIGNRKTLEKFNIPIVKDLPGVGKNLQDHVAVISLKTILNSEVGFKFSKDINAENFEMWEKKRKGPLAVPVGLEGISFIDSEYSDKSKGWPDLEFGFFQVPLRLPFKEGYTLSLSAPHGKNYLHAAAILLRPKSVGHITIKSEDFHDPPVSQPNYLSEKDDVLKLISGMKVYEKFTKTNAFKKYEAYWDHDTPTKGCEQFKFMSDEYLECHIRHYSVGFFHQCCTSKMGPKDDTYAVVDNKLRVYGVKNLRVVDLSVVPKILSGHTMIPSIMIGEKAADIIKGDWAQRPSDEL